MKPYTILFTVVVFSACGGSGTDNSSAEQNESEKPSTACDICLLRDSIDEVEKQRAVAAATRETAEKQDALNALAEKLGNELDSLEQVFERESSAEKKQNPDLTFENLSDSKNPYAACRAVYPFDLVKDAKKREELFFNYKAYTDFVELPYFYMETDTADLPKEDGHYLVKNQGELLRIPFADFPAYWEKVELAHDALFSYVLDKRNESAEALGGKKIQDMSKIEILMLSSHGNTYESRQPVEYIQVIKNDERYAGLVVNFWKAMGGDGD
jgi:hypothetical protein